MTRWLLLAESGLFDEPRGTWKDFSARIPEGLWIFAGAGLITLGVILWAVYFRKKRRHRHGHGRHVHEPERAADEQHHRRRRRRHHRPRNPTLAETGGLPPVRPERPPEPFP